MGAQQSQFAFLQAKDLADAVDGLMRTHDVALWNGNDTSLSAPTCQRTYSRTEFQGVYWEEADAEARPKMEMACPMANEYRA